MGKIKQVLTINDTMDIENSDEKRINLLSTQISGNQVQLICKQLGDRVQNVHDEPE